MLAMGINDVRVPIRHGDRFRAAMKDAEKNLVAPEKLAFAKISAQAICL
jgi:hypothetical protein